MRERKRYTAQQALQKILEDSEDSDSDVEL